MRVLLTTPPGFSGFNASLTLAAGLRAAGHEVAYATAPSFASRIAGAGYLAFGAGLDYDLSVPESIPRIHQATGHGAALAVFAELARRGMVEDLETLIGRWHPDLMIRSYLEFGAWIAAERCGIPLAWASPGGLDLPAVLLASFTGDILTRELPGRYGLPTDPGLSRLYSYPYLNTMPAEVTPPGFPLPPLTFRYRDRAFDPITADSLPDWVGELGDRPVVHASLGTVFSGTGEGKRLHEVVLEALSEEPVDLILAIGPKSDPEDYGRQPPNVRIVRHIAEHRAFLDHCDVLVTHGGAATSLLAIAAGAPACFLPLHADQPILAKRLTDLGAGLIAGSGPDDRRPFPAVDIASLRPQDVRESVQRLLTERSFTLAMRRLSRQGRALPPVAEAVSWLERTTERTS
ncbi:MAG: glycosyltransferase [Actinomycetota bacterium]|nr:glycosyltransferase [Actinomycetota bacterium]